MKKLILTVLLAALTSCGVEQSRAGKSHTLIQRTIKQDLTAQLNYPDSLVLIDYKFTPLAGNTGQASYTFKAKNALGLDVYNTAYLIVVINDDLTIKEMNEVIIK